MVELEKLLEDVFGFELEIVDVKVWWDGSGIVFEVSVTPESFTRIRSWIVENADADCFMEESGGIWWGNFYFYVRG